MPRTKAPKLPTSITLDGSLDFKAAEGSDDKLPDSFFLKANTGKPVTLGNFPHQVIVDMKGARFDKQVTPVIADHNTGLRIGHTNAQIILKDGESGLLQGQQLTGPMIAAAGIRSSESNISKEFAMEAKKGFPFQVSIGARIKKGYILEEGETAQINGRVWEGPLVVASQTTIRELTVTVLGADNDTSAIFAKEQDMNFAEWLKTLKMSEEELSDEQKDALMATFKELFPDKPKKGKKVTKKAIKAADPDEDDDDGDDEGANLQSNDLEIQAADRLDRIDAIGELAEEFNGRVEKVTIKLKGKDTEFDLKSFRKHALKSKMSPTEFELHLRRSELPDVGNGGPSIQMVNRDMNAKALEVAILRYYGHQEKSINPTTGKDYGLKAMGYTDKDLELSHKRQHQFSGTIGEILAHQVSATGRHPSVFHNDPSALMTEAVRAWNEIKAVSGASALDITNILENVMHKEAYASFESQETTWRNITGVRSLSDFRVHNNYRLDMNGHFRKVPTDGELKHVGMSDSKYTLQAETYGAMIMVDRKTRINDDLGMVMAKARGIGMLGALRVEEAVYVTLLSNPGSFFAAGNNNLITGGGTALGITAFTTAQQKFRDQVINGKPIAVSPSILLVGTNNAILANRLYNETRLEATGSTDATVFVNNPFAGLYRPVVTGYLNNTSITDQDGNALSGQSNNHWYLFSNPNQPQGSALVIGFLNGRQTPFIDEAETQFNVPGGIQMRAYFDFGVGMHITQLALRSAGS